MTQPQTEQGYNDYRRKKTQNECNVRVQKKNVETHRKHSRYDLMMPKLRPKQDQVQNPG